MGAQRASMTAVAAVAGTVLVVCLLVTWASSIGPDRVLAGDGPATHRISISESQSASIRSGKPTSGTKTPEQPDVGQHLLLSILLNVFVLTVGLVMLTCVGLLLRWLLLRWLLRRRPPPPEPEVDFDPLEPPRRVAEEMVRDAAAQRHLLEQGTPRNGIVACWRRFEEQAEAAGVRRGSWETSAEFSLRILELVDAESHQVARLAALYREARFSDHPLGESARAEALAALDAIHHGLFAARGARR